MPARCRPVAVLAAALLALAPVARAQDKPKVEIEQIQFETADGVQLQGDLYKALMLGKEGGKLVQADSLDKAPVVMLFHPYLGDPTLKEWDGLAVTLARAGFHVFKFDFRGHTKRSQTITKSFWDSLQFPENSAVFSAKAKQKPLPLKLELADLKSKPGYFPMLVNDIVAARVELDKLSSSGKLNTSTVYLLGVGDAATLGMFYMSAEWTRPQKLTDLETRTFAVLQPNNNIPALQAAGKDIAGAIWVSPARPAGVPERTMQDWVKMFPDMRDSTPVLCLYGEQDTASKKVSEFIRDEVLVAKPMKKDRLTELKWTLAQPIAKTKESGVKLMALPATEKFILDYLETLEKDRKVVNPVPNRNFLRPPYVSPQLFKVPVR